MTEWRRWVARLSPIGLLALIAAALVAPQPAELAFAGGGASRADGMMRLLDELPDRPIVLVAFDPDLGTYAEIRETVRALLADLLERDASLALISLTAEGRALSASELARLREAGTPAGRLSDLGYRAGAEAALVDLIRDPLGSRSPGGGAADALADEGLAAADLALIVGGNDLGPRSWVEQVRTRQPGLPFAAVAPTILLPEVTPYLLTGQLDALLGTVADGAAFREGASPVRADVLDGRSPLPLPFLVGMVVAIAVLVQAAAGTLIASLPVRGQRT
jgi:hypothetical protein